MEIRYVHVLLIVAKSDNPPPKVPSPENQLCYICIACEGIHALFMIFNKTKRAHDHVFKYVYLPHVKLKRDGKEKYF